MTTNEPELPPTNLALTIPKGISELAGGSAQLLAAANEFTVDSEPAFQVADEMQVHLKTQAKVLNDKRLEFTRPIDAIKKKWLDWFAPAIDTRLEAAKVYQFKMSRYREQQRAEAVAAQREAERLLREEREKREAEARKLEQKAAKLKTAAAQEKAKQQAEEIRQVAAMMPESVALSAATPQTVASNVAELWRAEVTDAPEFLKWLLTRPEWLCAVTFKESELNRLAKQCQNVVKVPGVKFFTKDSYRAKSR